MYARLWWKETRLFWPIWVAIGMFAAGVQWLLLWSKVPEARVGFLVLLGLGWSLIYALAVGAGVFAGDRESKTQVFLDTLPVGRRMLWTSKVSFALVTTLGLALALTVVGVLGTPERDPRQYDIATLLLGFGVVLLEGVAWSLFWSVVLRSSLQAALAGLLTVGSLNMAVAGEPASQYLGRRGPGAFGGYAAGAGRRRAGVLVARLHAGTARRRTGMDPAGARPTGLAVRAPDLGDRARIDADLAPAGGGVGWIARGVGGPSPSVGKISVRGPSSESSSMAWAAGVSVFGSANRTQSYRFLACHGVRPGVVWATKVILWLLVTTVLLLATALPMVVIVVIGGPRHNVIDSLQASFVIFEAFVIAVLAGQVVRRSITAWVVAILAFALLVMPQYALVAYSMIPIASLALFPLLVLAISWAWTGDWMNDLRGAARWFRLGGMIGAAAALLVSLYIGYRAWSVPDVGAPFPPRLASADTIPMPADQDAAPDYARIVAELNAAHVPSSDRAAGDGGERFPDNGQLAQVMANGWDPKRESVVAWWEARRGLVEPIRRAAAKPEARFPHSGSWPSSPDHRLVDMHSLLLLLGLDNFERRARGDLAGAWDDLRAAFRMAEQFRRSGPDNETSLSPVMADTDAAMGAGVGGRLAADPGAASCGARRSPRAAPLCRARRPSRGRVHPERTHDPRRPGCIDRSDSGRIGNEPVAPTGAVRALVGADPDPARIASRDRDATQARRPRALGAISPGREPAEDPDRGSKGPKPDSRARPGRRPRVVPGEHTTGPGFADE